MKTLKIAIAALFILSGFHAFAQLKKANKQFELYRYSKAIPLFEKASNSNDEKIRREATLRLADCYRFVNDAAEARSWYQKASEFPNPEPMTFFYLGQAARSLQDYEQARTAFLKFAELVPGNPRGKLYAGFCDTVSGWKDLPPSAEVKNAENLNSQYSDFGPTFYKQGIVYASDRNPSLLETERYQWTNFNYLDLYQSEPKYYKDFWADMQQPTSMSTKFNQSFHDGPASFNGENSIFITRTGVDPAKKNESKIRTYLLKIYYARLIDNKIEYKAFPFNNDKYSVGHPSVSADSTTMIFVSDMPGGSGESDLYVSHLTNGVWGTPVNLGSEINSVGSEVFPTIGNDSTLYFASDGHPGYGGLDLFVSRKVNGKWTTPQNMLAPVNSSYDDFSFAISDDLKGGFFSSNRPGGKGNDDIYAFRMQQVAPVIPAKPSVMLAGFVKEKSTRLPLPGAGVYVLNTRTNKVKILQSDATGAYSMPAEKGVLYVVKSEKQDYIDDCINFRIDEQDQTINYAVPRDLLLDKLEVNRVFAVENIYYDLDKWFIREDAKPALDNLADIMKKYPITAELSSHTDCRASNAYNDELSQKRAESAVRYIVLQGVDPSRIIAKGYGETKLINQCADGVNCTEPEHQANRRTEFRILSIDKPAKGKKFDPSLFKVGENVDVYLFDPEFFQECFGIKAQPAVEEKFKESATAVSTTQAAVIPPANIQAADCYCVQLLATSTELSANSKELKGIKDARSYYTGKWYKYVTGCEKTYEEAAILQKSVIEQGFPQAFVVKIENGKIVSAR